MDTSAVATDVRKLGGSVAVIDVAGEVTSTSSTALMSAYETASAPGVDHIIMNFDNLEYMNSGGIGVLVTLLVRANRQHQSLGAVGLSEHYREIMALTRLDEAIAIHASEDAALAALVGASRSGHGAPAR